jgi:type II secretory pathway pseudopilin PulG
MRGGTDSRGYTIVEVMIFLAISGLMFVIAATFISGKQAKTQFRQAMNAISSDVLQTIDDVSNGYYPSVSNFSCVAGAAGSPTFSGGSTEQGKNGGCVFLGKAIQFGLAPGERTKYNIYSVAGRQFAPGSTLKTPTNFTEAQPIAIPAATESKTYEQQIESIKVSSSGFSQNGIGFFGSFGSYNTGNGILQSGSQSLTAVYLPGGPGTPLNAAVIKNPATYVPAQVVATPKLVVCFDSGSGQYGTLTIGGQRGQRLTTKIQIYNTLSAAPPGECT